MLLLVLSASSQQLPNAKIISGKVVSAADKAPVEGAFFNFGDLVAKRIAFIFSVKSKCPALHFGFPRQHLPVRNAHRHSCKIQDGL